MVQSLILILALALLVFPTWAIVSILALGRRNEALERRLAELAGELRELREKARGPAPVAAPTPSASAPEPAAPLAARTGTPSATAAMDAPPAEPPALPESPPLPDFVAASAPPPLAPPSPPTLAGPPEITRPTPAMPPPLLPPAEPPAQAGPAPRINWEQFMGAKLFAWLGGFAAFLGAAFFVKYSFEHDLIPPEVRVALGFLFGLALVIGGLTIPRARYAVTAQTLCATGIVTLYAVTFAGNSVYHFAFFGATATFGLMTAVTAVAFVLAARLEAQVVAILGLLGGFVTPVLLSTGRDNPPGLFGYIALLDLGLIAVALRQRWQFLVPLGAAGTVLLQIAWAVKFLNATKVPTAMVVCLGFCALFLAGSFVARRLGRSSPRVTWSAAVFPFVAMAFALVFMSYPTVAARPGLLFGFVLLADACLLALAWFEEDHPKLHLVAGLAVFSLLAGWTGAWLTRALLPWALGFYLLHGVLHTAFPVLLERHRPAAAPAWWSQLFPPLALLMMMVQMLKLEQVSLAFWPCVLLVDLLAIGLALLTASLAVVVVVLILTLVTTGLWLFHGPATLAAEFPLLCVIGGTAVLFFTASWYLARRLGDRLDENGSPEGGIFGDARFQLPAFSALLPFLLLIMMALQLPLANPAPIFGLALILTGMVLGLVFAIGRTRPDDIASPPKLPRTGRLAGLEWLPACALAGVAALEFAWHARHFSAESPLGPLAWYLLFYATFAVYPFVARRRFSLLTGPWAVAALSGVLQFALVYRAVQVAWPSELPGLVPALFSVPPLVSLMAIRRAPTNDARARLNQLAWFGGVALFFVTLVFPIQFELQWLTVGWALEGAALLWLFRRVPHRGLRATGLVLLAAAFARLALNPDVLEYHPSSGVAVLNWYLYTYGIVIACLFAGAQLFDRGARGGRSADDDWEPAPPRPLEFGLNVPAFLRALGTILAFLLLNIEIADFFSVPGSRVLTFQFSGDFARDMTYTIAWALFALGLLLTGIWKKIRLGRRTALVLLGVALLKLFLHDLARLEALYRIGALFAVATIAIIASVAYQRFLPGTEKSPLEKS